MLKYFKKLLSALLIFTLLFSASDLVFKPKLALAATIVSDTFTRADSATVGAAETGGTWTEQNGAAIVSNTVRVGDINGASSIYQAHGTLILPYSISMKVVGRAGNNRSARYGASSTLNAIGDFVGFTPNTNSAGNFVIGGADAVTQTSTQIDLTVLPFWVWLDISDSGGGQVDINGYHSTTSTKPGSATLTLTNVALSTGAEIAAFYDSNAGGTYVDFDDILLSDASAAPVVEVKKQDIIWFYIED